MKSNWSFSSTTSLDFLSAIVDSSLSTPDCSSCLIGSNYFLFSPLMLSSIFFSLLNNPSFLSSLSNPLLKILPYGEYSNLACSIVFDFKPKSSPVKYSYLSKLSKKMRIF